MLPLGKDRKDFGYFHTEIAIKQSEEKAYPKTLAEYTGKLLLVGISYGKDSRKHSCVIEQFSKA